MLHGSLLSRKIEFGVTPEWTHKSSYGLKYHKEIEVYSTGKGKNQLASKSFHVYFAYIEGLVLN